jgi:16S rRNA (adenine(1408)-N(1))-methyltransferase
VDVGAGDGGFVVAAAARRPDTLAIAIDAHGPGMAPAWRRIQRQKLTNALLVVARAEALPPELDGRADAVSVHFPWGSLLSGVLEVQPAIAAGLARITKPGAGVTILVSVTNRESALGLPPLEPALATPLGERYTAHGLTLAEWRPATLDDIAASRSSWAKRLGTGDRRDAWLLRLVRAPVSVSAGAPAHCL